jgi:hypothetical protein
MTTEKAQCDCLAILGQTKDAIEALGQTMEAKGVGEAMAALRGHQAIKVALLTEPKRRFELTLEIGADTMEELQMLLDHFERLIAKGNIANISGGYGSGGSYRIEERPLQTHEQWQKDLDEHIAKRKSTPK